MEKRKEKRRTENREEERRAVEGREEQRGKQQSREDKDGCKSLMSFSHKQLPNRQETAKTRGYGKKKKVRRKMPYNKSKLNLTKIPRKLLLIYGAVKCSLNQSVSKTAASVITIY